MALWAAPKRWKRLLCHQQASRLRLPLLSSISEGAAADVVGQMVNNPGGPINYTEAGISGTVSSAAGFGFSQGPIEEHLPPQVGTGTLNQLSNFGTRSASGLLDFAVTNNRGLVGGALTGGGVPSEQSYFMGPGPHTVGGQSGAVLLV